MEDQEERLVQMGNAAEVLLDTEAFSTTINQLVDASFQSFSNSAAGEVEKREQAYHHYRALVDIVSTLKQRVQIKDEIITKANDDNNQTGEE